LSYIAAYDAAKWIFLAGSCFFVLGAVFGASDSLIKADQFILFFGSLFGKCMIAGTFAFLFGSAMGVLQIWAKDNIEHPGGVFWISNIQAASLQAGGVFFLLGSLLSFVMIVHKNAAREDVTEKTYLIH